MKTKIFLLIVVASIATSSCETVLPPTAYGPVPNEHQLAWHELERYAFIHFTVNTFTDKEWGYGDEPESIFSPTAFDAEQWAKVVKEAGLTGIVLTCKHHDGFCLWPSAYTEHSVKHSPFMDGKGDIVRAVSDACKRNGLFFGVYLSPWDRNHAQYGTPEYITYYRNQLTELLNNYGEVKEVWFDGANGGDGYYGGAKEMRRIDNRTYYDWANTHTIVRRLAPRAMIFSDGGPDIRWCGNERGYAGETNWCLMFIDTIYAGKSHIEQLLNHGTEDGNAWLPSEVDVSIRPGWFYHQSEDNRVKTPEALFKIYLESVGRGSNLILNLPPDRRGLINELDVASLRGWKKLIDQAFSVNLAADAKASADKWRGKSKKFAASNVLDGDKTTYWATDDEVKSASVEITLSSTKKLNYIFLQEYITLGQRVKSFTVDVLKEGQWERVTEGTTIGYKRILSLKGVETSAVRVNIIEAKACPLISSIELY